VNDLVICDINEYLNCDSRCASNPFLRDRKQGLKEGLYVVSVFFHSDWC